MDESDVRCRGKKHRAVVGRIGEAGYNPFMDSPATLLLERLGQGDHGAAEELLPILYGELRSLAGRLMGAGKSSHTLQPTALVHEAYLRLVDRRDADWNGRGHFFRVAAKAMRGILIDHARSRGRDKRGGGRERVPLDAALDLIEQRAPDLLALDEALSELERHDRQLAEVVELRFFVGLTVEETARAIGVSTPTVGRQWRVARTLLRRQLEPDGPAP